MWSRNRNRSNKAKKHQNKSTESVAMTARRRLESWEPNANVDSYIVTATGFLRNIHVLLTT